MSTFPWPDSSLVGIAGIAPAHFAAYAHTHAYRHIVLIKQCIHACVYRHVLDISIASE